MNSYKYIIYSSIISLISLGIFLYGFFPLTANTNDLADRSRLPQRVLNQKLNQSLYSPSFGRVILMVIDALRTDFVYTRDHMPNLNKIIHNEGSCTYISEVKSPTVTLPRIKALTAGNIPAYIDVLFNFGSQALNTDNIVHQIRSSGRNIVFYGDDTWIKLFPNYFKRYDGTTSFYVSDFYEVDNNVTYNLEKELKKSDWSFMILHYLGLDHIGHVEGPRGRHIKPKLNEMDEIIKKIHAQFMQQDVPAESPNLFIICGDHGMRDSGGHGGSSKEETEVPLIMIGTSCSDTDRIERIQQIDLAPTLAVLLGLPIPLGSMGVILEDVMSNASLDKKLYSLLYNSMHLIEKCEQHLEDVRNKEYYKDYLKAKSLYAQWLNSNRRNHLVAKQSINLFITSTQQMSRDLSNLATEYHGYYLIMAIIIKFEALLVIFAICFRLADIKLDINKALYKNIIMLITVKTVVLTIINITNDNRVWLPQLISSNAIIALILSLNFHIIKNIISRSTFCMTDWDPETFFAVFGVLVHTFSLSSTSFIEEEHLTYYHLSGGFILVLFLKYIRELYKNLRDWSSLCENKTCLAVLFRLFIAMVITRVLRHLNSTGDKYRNVYDIADWLNESDHRLQSTVFYLFALCSIYYTIQRYLHIPSFIKHLLLLPIFYSIYQFKSLTSNLYSINSTLIPSHYITPSIFTILTIIHLLSKYFSAKLERSKAVLILFLVYCTFLQRPCNTILIPAVIFVTNTLLNCKSSEAKFGFHPRYIGLLWIGFTFYFFQGNSNSLSSIDVSSGYTGLTFYNPILVGIQIAIHTYTGPILVILTILASNQTLQIDHFIGTLSLCRVTPLTWYLIMVYIQRHHLFAWTVFAPKLMFETTHSVINLLIIFVLYVCRRNFNKTF